MVDFGGVAQPVEDDARLDVGQLGGRVDPAQRIHVPREIEDHGNISALPRKASSSSARQDGGSGCPAGGQGGLHIRGVAGQDDPDGKLAVV